jgi:hypothetical protein
MEHGRYIYYMWGKMTKRFKNGQDNRKIERKLETLEKWWKKYCTCVRRKIYQMSVYAPDVWRYPFENW